MARLLTRTTLLAVVAAIPFALATPAGAAPGAPVPGAPGVGDRLFPDLGNGGFDVLHYDISLDYDPAAKTFSASTVVTARATQSLSRFDLDFDGNTITSLRLDGRSAAYTRSESELVITPDRPLHRGTTFSVKVGYTGNPNDDYKHGAWIPAPDGGFVVAGQPDDERSVYPSSDHPTDKASYTFHLTAPDGWQTAANGVQVRSRSHGGKTTTDYVETEPMASELVEVSVGKFSVVTGTGPHGLPIRSVVPTAELARYGPIAARSGDHVAWMEQVTGRRYPFGEYGVQISDASFGFALENQTLSLFTKTWFVDRNGNDRPESYYGPVMVHELAHQWFGDAVSPSDWQDVWLNEGHATWYEAQYADAKGYAPFVDRMKDAYRQGDKWRKEDGPVAGPSVQTMWNDNVYDGGALVLYALYQTVGAKTFYDIERAWLDRYHFGHASTQDWINLVSRVSHRDLHQFLSDWLYGTKTPPMPGHPDWTVDPA
jgi:aminopeptidase N